MNASGRTSTRAFWGLASWLLPLVVVFLLAPRLLHLLGPERFGILMIVLVTPVIASQLDFGLSLSAVRRLAADLSQGQIDGPRTLFSYAVAFFAIAVLFGVVVACASEWLADALGFSALLGTEVARELTRWCALWGAVSIGTAVPAIVARAAQSFGWLTATQTLATVVLWAGALLIIGARYSLQAIVALGILVSALSTALLIFATRRAVRWDHPLSFQASIPTQDMRFATGMFAAQVAGTIAYQADRVLVSSFGSPAIAGAYTLCTNLANKPLAAIAAITSFASPLASSLHTNGARDELATLLHALDRAVGVIVIPLLLPALWLAQPFLILWLGTYGTPDLALAFQVLLMAFAMPTFSIPAGHVLAASGRSGPAARFAGLTATIVVIGIIVLVPRYGLLGAVTSIFLAMSTSLIFSWFARRTLALKKPPQRIRFLSGMCLGVIAESMVLFLAERFVSDWSSLVLVSAIAWSAFFFSRAIFQTLSNEEVRLLKQLTALKFLHLR